MNIPYKETHFVNASVNSTPQVQREGDAQRTGSGRYARAGPHPPPLGR